MLTLPRHLIPPLNFEGIQRESSDSCIVVFPEMVNATFRKFLKRCAVIAVIFAMCRYIEYRMTTLPCKQMGRLYHIASKPSTPVLLKPGPKCLVHDFDCQRIIEGDQQYISVVNETMSKRAYKFQTDRAIGDLAQHCENFFKVHDYNSFVVSNNELDFPIAYTILTHKDATQTEKLLRTIYRPHNIYCIHVDKHSNTTLLYALKSISNCLPNVFISSKLEDVVYAGFSRLRADLNCMSDLLNQTAIKWQYVINLPSQVYPLKTNSEIVKILKIYNGISSIESVYDEKSYYRCNESYSVKNGKMEATGKKKDPPPFNITVGKGSAYGVFSWSFVNYTINDDKAQVILNWLYDTYSPDEFFWATLASNKHLNVPGVLGFPDRKLWIAASVTWQGSIDCHGKYVRDVCVFGIGDLNKLVSEKELFANKFYHDYQPLALQCMEEWYLNKSFSPVRLETYHYRKIINSINNI
ncbi:beta-1,3-galactosyl-O-glycosyl-glycoprotein beta-1,6-N-acetylglucosaminyltransferase 3-like [Saccostrea echinata]|uniref:beta-1,3-galactosyl-O-glycosyl-glycoprotein beta-1,6-N-acetylglucosaminyltransferase 3-like n=1 Tax=Saccostrea echinata TaxID=191078 RepID=UPI002A811499|nr:beta-1,3-galactosyl-O-glycosyl-glycoprotein beta-1,6-N-acetylglucosaminyltransferase 3-like [Saccostrea echinata]